MDREMIGISSMFGLIHKKPFVKLTWGKEGGLLTPEEARRHAMDIMEAADAADSDAFLWHFGVKKVGLDIQGAAKLINEFREYRRSVTGI